MRLLEVSFGQVLGGASGEIWKEVAPHFYFIDTLVPGSVNNADFEACRVCVIGDSD